MEALEINPERAREVITLLWKMFTQLNYKLKDWESAILVPIYKKGDVSSTTSYRPIALLSHARKVIEDAIAH